MRHLLVDSAEFPAVVTPRLTSDAAILGRTLLCTAFTRVRGLVVIVGQQRAPAMAAKDRRRTERRTALDGLLAGALRFAWPRLGAADGDVPGEAVAWRG